MILWTIFGFHNTLLVICGDGLWFAVMDLLMKDDQEVHKVYSAGVFDLFWSNNCELPEFRIGHSQIRVVMFMRLEVRRGIVP